MSHDPAPLPPLAPILERLEAQLANAPGGGRLTREDVITLAVLAVERDATERWTVHKPNCSIGELATWLRRCTCGLEGAEARAFTLRRRLIPAAAEPAPDPRRRGKRGAR
ncbi:MAG: hypothetical protein V4850_16415 [Myxococcota bacterium]